MSIKVSRESVVDLMKEAGYVVDKNAAMVDVFFRFAQLVANRKDTESWKDIQPPEAITGQLQILPSVPAPKLAAEPTDSGNKIKVRIEKASAPLSPASASSPSSSTDSEIPTTKYIQVKE